MGLMTAFRFWVCFPLETFILKKGLEKFPKYTSKAFVLLRVTLSSVRVHPET